MLIMDNLGIGGSFAEFHPVDFKRISFWSVMMAPPYQYCQQPTGTAQSKEISRQAGPGASVEFKIKEGPITMLSIGLKADGKFKFIIGEGESVAVDSATGNTNTRGYFKPDAVTFLKNGWQRTYPHFACITPW